MILLLIGSAWILVVSLVLGLCAAARRGDEREQRRTTVAARREKPEPGLLSADAAARHGRGAEPAHELVGAGGTTG
jgi:hypothetical protein